MLVINKLTKAGGIKSIRLEHPEITVTTIQGEQITFRRVSNGLHQSNAEGSVDATAVRQTD